MPDEIKKQKSFWEILEALSKFTTSFLLVIIAFVLDIGSKRIAESNEEGKIIQSLIADLTTKQAESRNDVALLSLEKYLISKDTNKNFESDKNYLTEVAETILAQRVQEDSSFSLQSSIPFKILNKYDKPIADSFLTVDRNNKRTEVADSLKAKGPLSNAEVANLHPIVQSTNATEASVISSFNKKICYIQYNDSANIGNVKNFQGTLKSKEWIAPGIEYVAGNYKNIVKYFNDDDLALAQRAKALADSILSANFTIIPILSSKYKVPKGQLEIWIGNK